MFQDNTISIPRTYQQISDESKAINFSMPSDLKTGSFLRSLVASKPGGNFLEIGTGTGLSLTWMAEGADANSKITSIDNEASYQKIARYVFDNDPRVSFICADGNEWLSSYAGEQFDLIFADAWPGKFEMLDETLSLVKPGGYYLIDDLLPQPNWPEGHHENVDKLMTVLSERNDFVNTSFNWSTGLRLFTKISG